MSLFLPVLGGFISKLLEFRFSSRILIGRQSSFVTNRRDILSINEQIDIISYKGKFIFIFLILILCRIFDNITYFTITIGSSTLEEYPCFSCVSRVICTL